MLGKIKKKPNLSIGLKKNNTYLPLMIDDLCSLKVIVKTDASC